MEKYLVNVAYRAARALRDVRAEVAHASVAVVARADLLRARGIQPRHLASAAKHATSVHTDVCIGVSAGIKRAKARRVRAALQLVRGEVPRA